MDERKKIYLEAAVLYLLIAFGFLLVLVASGCSLVQQPTLTHQLNIPGGAITDAVVVQAAATLSDQWSGRNDLSALFSYGAEVTLAGLAIAMVSSPQPGLAIGTVVWLALLKIFQPDAKGLVYVQGMEDLTDGLTVYILCSANNGRVTVPADQFTPCGAELFVTVGAASNNVNRGLWMLRPRRSDLERVEPVPIEKPQGTLAIPRKAIPVPRATIP